MKKQEIVKAINLLAPYVRRTEEFFLGNGLGLMVEWTGAGKMGFQTLDEVKSYVRKIESLEKQEEER